jgi:hypothetical protein
MGDIDFVIRPEDREETDRILRNQMGFERSIDVHEVWTYWKGKIYLEVHSHMFYAELANRTDYRSYFDHVWEHCHKGMVFGVSSDSILVPDVEYHFLYLAVHTAKHIIASGSGFRAYMDMAILGREAVGMDWDYISKELEQLSLREFAATCMTLCERWFGTSSPMGLEKADEEFLVSVTEKTFRDGVFGLENSENVEADTAKQIWYEICSCLGSAADSEQIGAEYWQAVEKMSDQPVMLKNGKFLCFYCAMPSISGVGS